MYPTWFTGTLGRHAMRCLAILHLERNIRQATPRMYLAPTSSRTYRRRSWHVETSHAARAKIGRTRTTDSFILKRGQTVVRYSSLSTTVLSSFTALHLSFRSSPSRPTALPQDDAHARICRCRSPCQPRYCRSLSLSCLHG